MRVGGEHRGQLQAGFATAQHGMGLFEIEEQVAVQRVDQCCATECAAYLGQHVEGQLALVEPCEQCEGDTHGWVQVRTGNTGGEVDGHADAHTPDDTDFPKPEAGAGHLERGDAAGTEEDEQGGAEKLGQALAGQCGLAQSSRHV
ncbi:hypothetical protein D3C79_816960 [compost metagenome]